MNALRDKFIELGTYYLQWESKSVADKVKLASDHPLFTYPPLNRKLNVNLSSLTKRKVEFFPKNVSTAPFYILNIPFVLPVNPVKAQDKWNDLISKIRDESFSHSAIESRAMVPGRINVIIGLNRASSLSWDEDHQFKLNARSLNLNPHFIGFNCRLISTLWKTNFIFNHRTIIGHPNAQILFLVLEYLDVELAAQFKDRLENDASHRERIPFVHIREWIKNEMISNLFTDHLHFQPTYMMTLDDDIISLRGGGEGLFTTYDEIVRSRQNLADPVHSTPRLMSTGYYASPAENRSTQLGLEIDMRVRKEMNEILPGSPYFPEPNTGILINEENLRSRLSFIPRSLTTLDTEGRRLLDSIRTILNMDPSRILFIDRPCLFTTIPERLKASKEINSFQFREVGTKQVLKSFKGMSQSHAKHSILNNNMLMTLTPLLSPQKIMKFKSSFKKIYPSFDPICLAQTFFSGRYSHLHFQNLLEIYVPFINSLWQTFQDPGFNFYKEDWMNFAQHTFPQAQGEIIYGAIFDAHLESIMQGHGEAVDMIGDNAARTVVEIARNAGYGIYCVFKERVVL